MSLLEKNGFFWIRLKSPQGHVFAPLIAWRQAGTWRIPGSAERIPQTTIVEILDGPLTPPKLQS